MKVENKEHAERITELDAQAALWSKRAKLLEARLKIAQGKRDMADLRLWEVVAQIKPAVKSWPGFDWDPETSELKRIQ